MIRYAHCCSTHKPTPLHGWTGSNPGPLGKGLANKKSRCYFSAETNITHKDTIYWADGTKVHIKAGRLSYCVARETRTLLNSSLHYHLFSQGKLKYQNKTTHWSRPHYKSKHWCGISVKKRKLKTKNKTKKNTQSQSHKAPNLTVVYPPSLTT